MPAGRQAAYSRRLTRRQWDVAALVAEGLTDREIAQRLFISTRTAESHVDQIRTKLGAARRSQVATWVTRQGQEGEPAEIPTNLPAELTSFIGREHELEVLLQLRSTSRLLALMGPGGCGKTRLALRLAAMSMHDYPQGLWFVDMAPLVGATSVISNLASTLGVREEADRPLLETLVERMRGVRALILLDNCEHVIDATAQVGAALLRACPRVDLLATSREPISVDGETTFQVRPLPVPTTVNGIGETDTGANDAVRLFADRASAALPSFRLEPSSLVTVGRICRQLDGVPLAIELAAARVSTVSLRDLSERLTESMSLLAATRRDQPARHRTLDAAIGWSHDTLRENERVVFRRISVFASSFTLDLAEHIAGGPPLDGSHVIESLTGLVSKSLLLHDSGRYWYLETVRQFARARLIEAGESEALRRRLAVHLAELAERRSTVTLTTWLPSMEVLREDLFATLDWSVGADPDLGLQLAVGAYELLLGRGYLTEAEDYIGRLLAAVPAHSIWLGLGTTAMARFQYQHGRQAESRRLVKEALQIAKERNDSLLRADALSVAGTLALADERPAEAVKIYEEALGLLRDFGGPHDEAFGLLYLGQALVGQAVVNGSGLAAGRELLTRSVAILDQIGLRDEALLQLTLVAGSYVLDGELPTARRTLIECVQIGSTLRDWRIAYGLEVVAALAVLDARPQRACSLAGAAASIYESAGNVPAVTWRQLVERALWPARQMLGPQAVDEAYAEGREMTFDQAMDFAVASLIGEGG